jgi:hypothetical protein
MGNNAKNEGATMKKLEKGAHIKAASMSKHKGCKGTVVNPYGKYIIVKCDEDSPNPLSYKSKANGEGQFFSMDIDYAIILKD